MPGTLVVLMVWITGSGFASVTPVRVGIYGSSARCEEALKSWMATSSRGGACLPIDSGVGNGAR